MKNTKLLLLALPFFLVGCGGTSSSQASNPSSVGSSSNASVTTSTTTSSNSSITSQTTSSNPIAPDSYITIAQAKSLIPNDRDETDDKYYITATIKEITDDFNGHMTIEDETGELTIFYSHSEDGEYRFGELLEQPKVGDEVTFYGTLKNYKGTYEMEDANMIGWKYELPEDLSKYTQMTVTEARKAAKDAFVRVSGQVVSFTYNISLNKTGFILADKDSSIYVYNSAAAKSVEAGDTVDVIAQKDYYGASESADYIGSNQLINAAVLSHQAGTVTTLPAGKISMKALIEKPFSEDITGQIFEVKAYISSVLSGTTGDMYTNYYLHDLSGTVSGRVYTQASGADFTWLDEYVTELDVEEGTEVEYNYVTVYVTPLNAKISGNSGEWRYVPVKVEPNADVKMANEEVANFVYDSFVKDQFETEYVADPNLEMITSYANSDLIDGNVTISYSSNNEDAVYFTEENGVLSLHTKNSGEAVVTIKINVGGTDYTKTLTIKVLSVDDIETSTVVEAVSTPLESEVTLRGIVGPSALNQPAFYLFDETGAIAVRMNGYNDFDSLNIGDEVIVTGTRTLWGNASGKYQITVANCTLDYNLYGEDNDYQELAKNYTVTDLTFNQIYELSPSSTENLTAPKIYQASCKIEVDGGGHGNVSLIDSEGGTLSQYSGNASQTEWLKEFDDGNYYTVEFALVDWNGKTYYRACVLSVTDADEVVTYNTVNFN